MLGWVGESMSAVCRWRLIAGQREHISALRSASTFAGESLHFMGVALPGWRSPEPSKSCVPHLQKASLYWAARWVGLTAAKEPFMGSATNSLACWVPSGRGRRGWLGH